MDMKSKQEESQSKPLLVISFKICASVKEKLELHLLTLPMDITSLRHFMSEYKCNEVRIERIHTNNMDIFIPKEITNIFTLNDLCQRFHQLSDLDRTKLYAILEASNNNVPVRVVNAIINNLDLFILWPNVQTKDDLGNLCSKIGLLRNRITYPGTEKQHTNEIIQEFMNKCGGVFTRNGFVTCIANDDQWCYGYSISGLTHWQELPVQRTLKRVENVSVFDFFKKLMNGKRFNADNTDSNIKKFQALHTETKDGFWYYVILDKNSFDVRDEGAANTSKYVYNLIKGASETSKNDNGFKMYAVNIKSKDNVGDIYEINHRGMAEILNRNLQDKATRTEIIQNDVSSRTLIQMRQMFKDTTSPLPKDTYIIRLEDYREHIIEMNLTAADVEALFGYRIMNLKFMFDSDITKQPETLEGYLHSSVDEKLFYEDIWHYLQKLNAGAGQDLDAYEKIDYISDYLRTCYGFLELRSTPYEISID